MNKIIEIIQPVYHKLVPEQVRVALYHSAPASLRQKWDAFGNVRLSSAVTEADIYYCYRLLLKREPSKEELSNWTAQVNQYGFDINRLVHNFLYSEEFINLQESESQPICVELESFKLFVRKNDYATGAFIAQNKVYEPLVARKIQQHLSLGDTFIDIGANVGYHAMLAASIVGKDGRVIAFEPLPTNCELLNLSISANKFDQVTVYPYAVGEKDDTLTLMVEGTYSNALLQTSEESSVHHTDEVAVRVVALDSFLTDIDRIDMVKMDIEGVEPLAWRGMENLILTFRPLILTEFFPDFIRRASQIEPKLFLQMIEQQGYEIFVLDYSAEDADILAPKNVNAILQFYANTSATHLDLLAVPCQVDGSNERS
jgi:FkbM family methyltransferase